MPLMVPIGFGTGGPAPCRRSPILFPRVGKSSEPLRQNSEPHLRPVGINPQDPVSCGSTSRQNGLATFDHIDEGIGHPLVAAEATENHPEFSGPVLGRVDDGYAAQFNPADPKIG